MVDSGHRYDCVFLDQQASNAYAQAFLVVIDFEYVETIHAASYPAVTARTRHCAGETTAVAPKEQVAYIQDITRASFVFCLQSVYSAALVLHLGQQQEARNIQFRTANPDRLDKNTELKGEHDEARVQQKQLLLRAAYVFVPSLARWAH